MRSLTVVYARCTYSQCMPRARISITFEPTHAHYGWPCATKCEQCEKDDKAYIERVRESERGFKHLTEHEDMVISQDGHVLTLLC